MTTVFRRLLGMTPLNIGAVDDEASSLLKESKRVSLCETVCRECLAIPADDRLAVRSHPAESVLVRDPTSSRFISFHRAN
jgi:hypothetical protein